MTNTYARLGGTLAVAGLLLPACYQGLADSSAAASTEGADDGADDVADGEDDAGDGSADDGASDGEPVDWEPDGEGTECNIETLLPPESYGTKVKTLLTGLPLTDAELVSLRDDPESLPDLIDTWVAAPESDAVFERFFRTAFQQTSGNNESLFHMFGINAFGTARFSNPTSARADELINRNFADSFGKTVVALVREGRPFNEVVTTDTYMMTTAMMSTLAFLDDSVSGDEHTYHGQTWRTTNNHFPTVRLLRDPPQPPLEEVLDPDHPNWMTFYSAKITEMIPDGCGVTPVLTVDTTQQVDGEWTIGTNGWLPFYIFDAIVMGRVEQIRRHNDPDCKSGGAGSVNGPIISRDDFADWRPVRISQPAPGQDATYFYEILKLRDANEIVLHGDRIGFLTHPGFLSTWLTNEDNSMRVAINQALIVALGASFDGVTVTDFSSEAINQEHAAPGSECFGCHQQLDPMRDFYRASFSNHYAPQLDPERAQLEAQFVFGDVETSGTGVRDLAQILADHPLFPYAWAQKMCFYANTEACPEGDELDRVVAAFVDANLDFRVLVRELFSSALVTNRDCVAGAPDGTKAVIARRSTFCQQMSVRLGVDNLCAIVGNIEDASALQGDVATAAASIPDDAFARSTVEPIVIGETGLFTRANREAACDIIAQGAYGLAFAGMSNDEVFDALVHDVMALPPSDERNPVARAILVEHVSDAVAAGQTEEVAMQSGLSVACMAPGSAGVGF